MRHIADKLLRKLIPNELLEHMVFEGKSCFGRLLAKSLKTNKKNTNFINLGCGNVYVKEMINIDFFGTKEADYHMDLRFPFKIEDQCIDGIVSEHTLEHLSYNEASKALSECYRILKPGSTIRIIVPDFSLFIEKYSNNDIDWFEAWKNTLLADPSRKHMRHNFTKMFALCFTANYYHHKSCWDFETIWTYASNAGFTNIVKRRYKEGTKPLVIDAEHGGRPMVSIYVEASKP